MNKILINNNKPSEKMNEFPQMNKEIMIRLAKEKIKN